MPITSFFQGALAIAAVVIASMPEAPAFGQTENPVYVDDSPQAWELFRQAQDQTSNNAGEAVRLYQELLDEFALRLIPATDVAGSSDHFKAVRQRVLAALQNNPSLLERYRLMQRQPAEQLLQAGSTNELELLVLTRSLTEAGMEALLRLAQTELEAGRFRKAQTYMHEARSHPDCTGRRAAHVHFMSAMAALYLNEADALEQALADLEPMGGEAVALRERFQSLLGKQEAIAENRQSVVTPLDKGQATASDLQDLVAEAIWWIPLEHSLLRRRLALVSEDQPLPGTQGFPDQVRRISERDADITTTVPTVSGEIVFVNEGHTVRALNRLSGRQLWSYSNLNLAFTERDVQGALDLSIAAVAEGKLVTLTGHAQPNGRSESGRIICLDVRTGSMLWSLNLAAPALVDAAASEQLFPHGAPIVADGMVYVAARRVSQQSMTSAYVVAVDLMDGKVRWMRYITSSGALRAARPFDTLVYHQGALYIATAVGAMARLEPATGEIKWLVRFGAPFNTGIVEPLRRPWEMTGPVITDRGLIAIQPDLRRVVLLDAETGSHLENHQIGAASEWHQPRYLLADDRMVYAVGSEIRAFELDDLEHAAWRLPSEPLPQSTVGEPSSLKTALNADRPFELRGRVQIVEGALIAPTSQGVVVIHGDTGDIVNRLPINAVGNPVAVESQLLLATGDRLETYMSFGAAQRMLRERIAQSPGDPEPALSLLRLGMRVRNFALALEAADLATRSINRLSDADAAAGDRRTELMSLLLELADAGVHTTTTEGELLFSAVSAVAVTSAQRVDYLLAYGDWLASGGGSGSLIRAVESYQNILADRSMAESWRTEGGAARPAAAFAQQRLSDLIVQRGADVYAAQADFAAIRLRQITASREPAIQELEALVHEFPFAQAATDAALLAADIQARRGEHRAAIATLLRLYRAAPVHHSPSTHTRLLGRVFTLAKHADWEAQRGTVLRHLAARHNDAEIITDAGSIRPSDWLASHTNSLPSAIAAPQWPVIQDQTQPLESCSITGSIVPLHPLLSSTNSTSVRATMPSDRILIRVGNTLRLIGGASPAAAGADPDSSKTKKVPNSYWASTLPGDAPIAASILHFDENDILLWLGSDAADQRAVMINAADGTLRWTTARMRELFPQAFASPASTSPGSGQNRSGAARGGREPMPDGDPFDPTHVIPLLNDRSLVLALRGGAVVCVDLADGKTLRWSRRSDAARDQTLDLVQIHNAALHESGLVLGGLRRSANGTMAAALIAVDPMTGKVLFQTSPELGSGGPNASPMMPQQKTASGGIKWLCITPSAVIVYGTSRGVEAIDLHSGHRLWSNTSYPALETSRAWLDPAPRALDGRLVVEDQRSRLRSVDLSTGAITEAFDLPWRGEPGGSGAWDPQELRSLIIVPPSAPAIEQSRIIAHYPQRVAVYEAATGAMIGADVISDERDYRWLIPAQNADGAVRMALISGRSAQTVAGEAGAPGRRTMQWMYRIYMLTENGKVVGDPNQLKHPLTERVQETAIIDGWLLLSTQSEIIAIGTAP